VAGTARGAQPRQAERGLDRGDDAVVVDPPGHRRAGANLGSGDDDRGDAAAVRATAVQRAGEEPFGGTPSNARRGYVTLQVDGGDRQSRGLRAAEEARATRKFAPRVGTVRVARGGAFGPDVARSRVRVLGDGRPPHPSASDVSRRTKRIAEGYEHLFGSASA
jgi:hypothetical protein